MVTRREFLKRSAVAAALPPASAEESARNRKGQPISATRKQPNILIIIADQLRWDPIGAYGLNPMGLTPNLDSLTRRGVLFEVAITNQPVCASSRACLLTGQYATQNGVWRNGIGLPTSAITFAKSFREAGYTTNYIGKWHLMEADNFLDSPTRRGWGHVPPEHRGGFSDLWEASNLLEFTTHPYEGEIYDGEGTPIRYSDQYRVDFLTGRTVRFLRQMQREPFLLVVSIYEPHYQDDLNRTVAPTGYAKRYANPFVPQDLRFYPGDWQRELPDYYGCVARLDEAAGTILRTLSELGLEENTIVVFTSDHGCHFHTRNPWNKYSAHDSSIRVPLAVQGPGFNRSLVIRQLMSHVDFAPTLLDMAGIPVPENMQGHSARPLLEGQINTWRNEVFVQISGSVVGRALRTEQFAYCAISPTGEGGGDPASDRYVEYQLYDVFSDPHQLVNLAGRVEYRETAARLREGLRTRIVEAGEAEPILEEARSRLYP